MADSPRVSYAFGPFRLDPAEKVLFREDVPVSLTPKAVETLIALVTRSGHIVAKDELLRIVWPDTFVEENNLAQNISALRRALGARPEGQAYIETIPKRGYRFAGTVVQAAEPEAATAAAPVPAAPIPVPATEEATPEAPSTTPPPPARSRDRRATWPVAVALCAVCAVAATMWLVARRPDGVDRSRQPELIRMAVLPFVNLGAPEDAYFAAGMTEEITTRLTALRQLAVTSSTTASAYRRDGRSAPQVAADLRVEYIVEGSIRWASATEGAQVRITPKLVRAADDMVVWTQQYDASLSNLFTVQGDIAYQITSALQIALEGPARGLGSGPTADTEAYLAYLRGITSYQEGPSDTRNQAIARSQFEEAVARDSSFAAAWGWLARVYAWQYNTGAVRTPETKRLALQAASTAIRLNPRLPEAHLGFAQVLLIDRHYDAALRALSTAQAGMPNSPELFRVIGWIEQRKGRWREARAAYIRAFDIDATATAESLAVHYMHLRDYPAADQFIGILRAGDRSAATLPGSWKAFAETGDISAPRQALALALAARAPGDARVRGLLARLEWFDGRHDRALALIRQMDGSGAWLPPNWRFPASLAAAQVYDSMGRVKDAAREYEAAYAELERRRADAPDDYQVAAAMGLAAAGLGRAADARSHGERAVHLLPASKDAAEGPLYLYLLAQIQAKTGDVDAAFSTLDEMFAVPGFYNETWIQRDPGFMALRKHPSFRARLERWATQTGDALLSPRSAR